MSTFVLKRKIFTLLADGTGKSISDFKKEYNAAGGSSKLGSFKEWYTGANTGKSAANQNILNSEASRAAQRASNKANAGAIGFQKGKNSVGILGGIKNTYAKAGTMGKAGMIGAGVLGAGLMAKGAASMFGGNKE